MLVRIRVSGCVALPALVAALLASGAPSGRADPPWDLLVAGGTLIDGTGGPPFRGDVGVRNGRIAAVGDLAGSTAARRIDATGKTVAPGFIDLHNHADDALRDPATRQAANYLLQGCTTLVTGNCGYGPIDARAYYDALESQGIGVNVAHLLPHGSLREAVVGSARRPPSATELARMEHLADVAMADGAWGMSTGLQYVPGSFADKDELIAVARRVGRRGGIYASHIRDEGDRLLESLEEAVEIGRSAEIRVHIAHFKATKQRNWGLVRGAARLIEQARGSGLRITADQYPYDASSTSLLAMLLPDEEREGGDAAVLARLADPAGAPRLRSVVAESLRERGRILLATCPRRPEWIGREIHAVAAAEGRDPVDVALEAAQGGDVMAVNFGMDEQDVRFVMQLPWVATASDGTSRIDDGSRPHPRSFGTFPRKLGFYAVREQVVTLPFAVRSATGLPADILGIADRGYVRVGAVADLVVFDHEALVDRATYEAPYAAPDGVAWVVIGGEAAVAEGRPTPKLLGRPLRRGAEQPVDE
jgi:N-acyl-D-aspartate/D-glutamate deacylase